MAAGTDPIWEFTIPLSDIDKSLLPPHARTAGTDTFREEVSKLFQRDFAQFGGWAKIAVDAESARVTWRADPNAPSPIEIVAEKLERGEHQDAIRLLEWLRLRQPDNVEVLTNLGMALSDVGQLDRAELHLRHAVVVAPDHASALVALGVAMARQQRHQEAIGVLRRAIAREPGNSWAHRNLGGCLLVQGQHAEAEQCFRRAAELNPQDQQAVFGLAQALQAAGSFREADTTYAKAIDINSTTTVAENARIERRKLAQMSFRQITPGVRPEAVMYCLDALRKFGRMQPGEVQKIGFEIAVLGRQGLDPHNPAQQYQLRHLPGQFSGLQLLCIMHVAFKMIAPQHNLGFDLTKEFEAAKEMFEQSRRGQAE